jgi:hypothetical protein
MYEQKKPIKNCTGYSNMDEEHDWFVIYGEEEEVYRQIREAMINGYSFDGSERTPDGKIRTIARKYPLKRKRVVFGMTFYD